MASVQSPVEISCADVHWLSVKSSNSQLVLSIADVTSILVSGKGFVNCVYVGEVHNQIIGWSGVIRLIES